MQTYIGVIYATVGIAGLLVLFFFTARRHGEPKRTIGQRIVRALFSWARFCHRIAVAADKAVAYYHLQKHEPHEVIESDYVRV